MRPLAEQGTGRSFDVLHCIGRGGFGEVYRATMVSPGGLRHSVALKMLRAGLHAHDDAVARLRDEAAMLATLEHRAILRVHDFVELDGRVAMVSEFVEGADLQQLLAVSRPPVRAAVEIVGEIASALHAAWATVSPTTRRPLALVHRDVKPANIRVGRDGAVKLLDFGVARTEEIDREAHTSSGLLVGTMGYLAPERLTGDALEPPSDVYALGCVLFFALTGERLFHDVTKSMWVAMSFRRAEHDAFLEGRFAALVDVPEPVRALLVQMLSHDPAARPGALAVADRCEEIGPHLPGASLRRWTRECTWPTEDGVEGDLTGRELSETSLVTELPARPVSDPVATPPPPPTPAPAQPTRGIGPVVIGVAGLVALVGLLVGSNASRPTGEAPAPPPPPSLGAPPATDPEPEPAPEPEPDPEVLPEPVPVPAPPPAPGGRGTVQVAGEGVLAARLVAVDGREYPPGRVPAGTYRLQVDFTGGATVDVPKPLTVPVGGQVDVQCMVGFSTCKWLAP